MRSRGMRYGVLLVLALAVTTTIGIAGSGASAASEPSISINDVAQVEGNSGNTTFVFTVTLSQPRGRRGRPTGTASPAARVTFRGAAPAVGPGGRRRDRRLRPGRVRRGFPREAAPSVSH